MRTEAPETLETAAELLKDCSETGSTATFIGGGTKRDWGNSTDETAVEVSTASIATIVEHNAADLTAVVRAGVKLNDLQEALATREQMLALDPPDETGEATVGGIVATGDSGPLRHRYGAVRDLIVGARLALADGTVAKSGGTVIKNVAGYDLAKLFCGSFGTLGLVGEVALRLHPRPVATATVRAATDDGRALQRAAVTMAHLPLEADCLDVSWISGGGEVLARFSGATAAQRAASGASALKEAGIDATVEEDDEQLWRRQRHAQRAKEGAVIRLSARPTDLARIVAESDRFDARVVGRAGLGISFMALRGEDSELVGAIDELRRALAPAACVVLDAPAAVRAKVDVWGDQDPAAAKLMRRVKERFDPNAVLNRGIYVAGI